jgi:hypothetical protein
MNIANYFFYPKVKTNTNPEKVLETRAVTSTS